MRILRCTALEGKDGGILDDAVTDLDGPTNGGVRVPGAPSAQDRSEEREQRLAVLPGRGVPQIRRAVVDGVGRAQLNPMASSQETSTTRVPGVMSARSSSVMNVSGASVSWSTQLTMMSCSMSISARRTLPCSVTAGLTHAILSSVSKWTIQPE